MRPKLRLKNYELLHNFLTEIAFKFKLKQIRRMKVKGVLVLC